MNVDQARKRIVRDVLIRCPKLTYSGLAIHMDKVSKVIPQSQWPERFMEVREAIVRSVENDR